MFQVCSGVDGGYPPVLTTMLNGGHRRIAVETLDTTS